MFSMALKIRYRLLRGLAEQREIPEDGARDETF
jgi:hypothetical protein